MQKRKPGRKPLPQEKKLHGMEVQMPHADIELLTEEAERRGVSRSELVRGMIEVGGLKGIRNRFKKRNDDYAKNQICKL